MSDRWTIATYVNGDIVDIGYYRNWREDAMFYEAVAIMAVFADCKNEDDYWALRKRLQPNDKKSRSYCGKRFLHEFEHGSEFPVLVDITRKMLYSSFCYPRNRDLLKIHDVGTPYEDYGEYIDYAFRKGGYEWLYLSCRGGRKRYEEAVRDMQQRELPFELSPEEIIPQNVDEMLNHYKMSFSEKSIHDVRKTFATEPTLRKYLSAQTDKLLTAYLSENTCVL